jgi:hypothetical protein
MTAAEFARSLTAQARCLLLTDLSAGPILFVQEAPDTSWWMFTQWSVHKGVVDPAAYIPVALGATMNASRQEALSKPRHIHNLAHSPALATHPTAAPVHARAVELVIESLNVLGVEQVQP